MSDWYKLQLLTYGGLIGACSVMWFAPFPVGIFVVLGFWLVASIVTSWMEYRESVKTMSRSIDKALEECRKWKMSDEEKEELLR